MKKIIFALSLFVISCQFHLFAQEKNGIDLSVNLLPYLKMAANSGTSEAGESFFLFRFGKPKHQLRAGFGGTSYAQSAQNALLQQFSWGVSDSAISLFAKESTGGNVKLRMGYQRNYLYGEAGRVSELYWGGDMLFGLGNHSEWMAGYSYLKNAQGVYVPSETVTNTDLRKSNYLLGGISPLLGAKQYFGKHIYVGVEAALDLYYRATTKGESSLADGLDSGMRLRLMLGYASQ